MKNLNNKTKIAVAGLIVFVLYFIYSYTTRFPLELLGINYDELSMTIKVIYLLIYEFVFISIIYLINYKRFKNDFIEYKNNFKALNRKYLEYWAVAFGLMIFSNILIVLYFPNSIANNQETIVNIFKIAPIYMFISSVIFAPFLEESVFRLALRNIFQNDKLFIIISGLIFGSLHVIGSFNSWADLIYIIPYSIPGFVFAYTLVKSKNIFVPISLHLFHNGLMMLLQVILLFFL